MTQNSKSRIRYFAIAVAAGLALQALSSVRSEAAVILYRAKADNAAITREQQSKLRSTLKRDAALVFAIPIYGSILAPAFHLPRINPAVASALTVLIFLDKQVKAVDAIEAADMEGNGYSAADAQLIASDSAQFRALLEKMEAGIAMDDQDDVTSISKAIREVYPSASPAFTEVQAGRMLLEYQARSN